MKLFSQKLEQTAIKSICTARRPEVQALLLSSIDSSYFHYEPCKAAYERLHTVAKKRSIILGYTELLEDASLNEEYRDVLREGEANTCTTVDRAKRLIDSLDKYRKVRSLYYMAKGIIDDLKKPEVDVELMLDGVTSTLTETRSHQDIADLVHSLGKDGNALDLIDDALSMEDEILLKSGFNEFDEKNGGLISEGVMLLAATTSGGKSTMLMQMLTNIYYLNKVSVANVSLEMNERKITRRTVSNLTEIPYWKFVKRKLEDGERAQAKKAWRKLHRFGEKNGIQYAYVCPKRSVTITQLLTLLKPYGYKVIGIDYVSLLEGVDEKDQWKALSAILRQCKIFSAENKCLVIVLAQLDSDDDRIRYSKGMLEHADAAWIWNYYKPEQRESKIIPVRQLKARDQELFPFELREQYEVMRISNLEESTTDDAQDTEPSEKGNGKSKAKGDDLNLNDDDEAVVDYDAGQK